VALFDRAYAMKLLRRLWLQRRIACLEADLATEEHYRATSADRIERLLRALSAERWRLTAIDRPPITHATGRQRSDGKIRKITEAKQ
jgi:hypothetical protein